MRKKKTVDFTTEQMAVVGELATRYVKVVNYGEGNYMYFYHFGKPMITDRMQTFVNTLLTNFQREITDKDLQIKVNNDWTILLLIVSKRMQERLDAHEASRVLFEKARQEYDRICTKIIAKVGPSYFMNMDVRELAVQIKEIEKDERKG